MSKLRYIENKEEYGIAYDWGAIRRAFRALKCPPQYSSPIDTPWETCAYDVEMSSRSTGKTTMAILWGMTIRKLYPGFQTGLLRLREDQIMPKNIRQMLDTIRTYDGGRYVRQLTDGRWNDIQHDATKRAFRYVNRDENGEIYEKDEPFLLLLAVNKSEDYKSALVAPKLDLLIFDEFIAELYDPDDMIRFMNIIKTIFRDRMSGRVCMMANTIKPGSPWFRELEISKPLRAMKVGDSKIVKTEMGTPIYLHLFDNPTKQRTRINAFFFGFKNPALAAIRGDGELWAYRDFQRILSDGSDEVITKRLKIDTGDELLGCDWVKTKDRGMVFNVHPVTYIRDEDIVLTNGQIWDKQHQRGRGHCFISEWLERSEERGLLYFSDAETATAYTNFMAIADNHYVDL